MNAVLSPRTSTSSIAPWVRSNGIDNASFSHSLSSTIERKYSEHEHLFLEGEKQTHLFLIVEGVVSVYKLLSDGRRQISSFAYPGDIVGLDSVGSHVNSGEALSECRIRCISVNTIEKLIRNEPGFGRALLYLTANELGDTREQLLSLGRKSAAEKLATFLQRIALRSEKSSDYSNIIAIPMKRSEIADFLGLTVETVSRTFTKLRTCQVIRLHGSDNVEILDPDGLKMIADGGSVGVS